MTAPSKSTVNREIFVVKKSSSDRQQTKIKRTKIFQQRKFKTTKYLQYENFCIVEMGPVEMSILSYFKPKDGLPDELEGSLSSILPSQAIALANKEVEKVISEKGDTKKRGATRDGVSIRCVVGLPLTEQNFSKNWIPSAFVHVVTTNTRFSSKFFHPARERLIVVCSLKNFVDFLTRKFITRKF